MRIIVLSFIILAAIMSPLRAESDPPVGIRTMTIVTSDTGREVVVTMWYPAGTGGETLLVGNTPVFLGVTARSDASIEDGSFPLVLVSHGGMRSAPNMAGWIGFSLARRGFVVAVVRPPGLGPHDAAAAVSEVWKRPADLSAAITALEHDPGWAAHIDFDRIGGLGFFLGGTTVLSLAGARMSAEDYARSCDEGSTGIDCGWFAVNDVDLREIDVRPSARSNHDSRMKAAIAVDPELTTIFTEDSLSAIDIPVEVINLGRSETILPGLDASQLTSANAALRYSALSNATHFSAFSVCKPRGAAILAAETGDDSLCRGGGPEDRGVVHATLVDMIADGLDRGWVSTQ